MKKKLLLVICITLAALLAWILPRVSQRNALLAELERTVGEYDPRSIVLQDTNRREAERLAARHGASLRITPEGTYARLTLPEGSDIREVLERPESLLYLGKMTPDYRVTTAWEPARPQYPVSDPDYERQTYLDYMNLGNLWETHRGKGITIAVIDTGIDTDHPEFTGRISELSYNATEDKTVRDYGWEVIEDTQGHGTASAGILAAAMDGKGTVGIAPEAELLVIKAECDSAGNFLRVSDLVFGLHYAISMDVSVINMSFGFAASGANPFAEAVGLAYDNDMICVAAACNRGTDALTWPAADEKVLGVGAIDEEWELAAYSNYGPNTDLVAPGTAFTTMMGGGYGTFVGTSFASPIVAGSVALLLEQEGPYLSAEALWDLLVASCRDLGEPGRDDSYGFGVPDVAALVLGKRGTVTFDLGEETETAVFLPGIPVQNVPVEAGITGWYYDEAFTRAFAPGEDVLMENVTLYAKWEAGDSPFTYEVLADGSVRLLSYTGGGSSVSVPDTLDGKPVSAIGEMAFAGQKDLRLVELPASIEALDGSAFWGAVSLENIRISADNPNFSEKDGVLFNASGKTLVAFPAGRSGHYAVPTGTTEIGKFAFAGSALETVELTGVRTVGISAFRGAALRELTIPDSVTRVWAEAFCECEALRSVQMGSGLKSTAAGLFRDCALLSSVQIPAGIRTINEETFAGTGLTEVTFPENSELNRIGANAFRGCRLVEVVLPGRVSAIEDGVFAGNNLLEIITLSPGLKRIGAHAFRGCAIREMTVPASVTEIGAGAFGGCKELSAIGVASENGAYQTVDGVLLSLDGTVLHTFPAGKAAESYTLPASVREIAPYAFAGTGKLETLVIPQGFEKLGEDALREGGFTGLVLPDSLKSIGAYGLAGCAVKELTVPKGVSFLGRYAFSGCMNLEKLTFAENSSLERIPAYLLAGCEKLQTITFSPGSALKTLQAHGFGELPGLRLVDFGNAKLTGIGNYAFRGCASLAAPEFPDSLKSIGRNAFDGCVNLGIPELPDGLEYQGSTFFVPGDADGDGTLSYNDALTVLRASIGLGDLAPQTQKACDMDGSGDLSYNDALIILRRSIGL